MIEELCNYSKSISINPDFIYNRIDLYSDSIIILHVQNDSKDYYLEANLFDDHAVLGIWMMTIMKNEFEEISKYIFNRYKKVQYLSFYYAISDKVYIVQKHYHINLPNNYNELKGRLSSKSRNTMNRKFKNAELTIGKVKLMEYENDGITEDVLNDYFKMKENTHHIHYGMSSKEYIEKYHVSNVYVLYFGNMVVAMVLTCEQCPIVYLENLTYDMAYSRYSPGIMAYEMVLKRLIEKGKKSIFLGGGDYDYKKKYNSTETIVTDGRIFRSRYVAIKFCLLDFYNRHLLWKIKKIIGFFR